MSNLEEHCKETNNILGKDFKEIHEWLDEFFGKFPYFSKHRYLKHHKEGIEEVKKLFGEQASKAAEIHIRQDLDEEGYPNNKPIPRNSEDYKRLGLW